MILLPHEGWCIPLAIHVTQMNESQGSQQPTLAIAGRDIDGAGVMFSSDESAPGRPAADHGGSLEAGDAGRRAGGEHPDVQGMESDGKEPPSKTPIAPLELGEDGSAQGRTRLRRELASIVELSLPIVISSVLNFMMSIVDLAMVGHLGREALAAASLGLAYYNTGK